MLIVPCYLLGSSYGRQVRPFLCWSDDVEQELTTETACSYPRNRQRWTFPGDISSDYWCTGNCDGNALYKLIFHLLTCTLHHSRSPPRRHNPRVQEPERWMTERVHTLLASVFPRWFITVQSGFRRRITVSTTASDNAVRILILRYISQQDDVWVWEVNYNILVTVHHVCECQNITRHSLILNYQTNN